MKYARLISRLASLGLASVLLILTGFSIWAVVITREATNNAGAAVQLSDQYAQARYNVGAEESLERFYTFEPGPATLAEFHAATASLVNSLQAVKSDGNASDRMLADKALEENDRYLSALRQMFAAIDAHNIALAHTIDDEKDDPVFSLIEQQVNTAANEHHQQAIASLTALSETQHTIFVSTPIVFAAGLLLLGVFWFMLRYYQRSIERSTKEEMERLELAALSDNLTALGNHRAFQEQMQRQVEQAQQKQEAFVLALINVDELKMLNDEHGHLYGDRILTALANLLRDSQARGRAYRLSGDEFALLLPQTTLADALIAMEKLRRDVTDALSGATVSIGIAVGQAGENDAQALYEQADAALCEAKHSGRNTVVSFEDIQKNTLLLSPAKVQAVRRLLAERNITIVFQPIWDLERGKLLSVEALMRPAAEYGFSGPQEVFEIAEKTGHAQELDYVCLQAILARAGELPDGVLLFINISPQTLVQDTLIDSILMEAVVSAGLTPERIVLEITERSVAHLPIVVREAARLQRLGFRLALDDTGAGNAGLEMLSQLPVDFVKIDRAIVVNAQWDKKARGVLAGIHAIANEADTYVIAEGIEDMRMLDLVREMGAQGVQGYLLGRPSAAIPETVELAGLSSLQAAR